MDRRRCSFLLRSETSRRRKQLLLGGAVAWIVLQVAIGAAGSVDALLAWAPLRCPLRFVTGIECPTCGLGHALMEAVAGNFTASWREHPAGLPILATLAAAWIAPGAIASGFARLVRRRTLLRCAVLLYALWGFTRVH